MEPALSIMELNSPLDWRKICIACSKHYSYDNVGDKQWYITKIIKSIFKSIFKNIFLMAIRYQINIIGSVR